MNRSWARAFMRRGWLLLGAPLLVVASLFVLLDHFFDEYLIALDAAEEIERRISQIDQMKAYTPRLQEVHQLLQPEYQRLAARSFKSSSPSTSIVQMEASLKALLQSLYFGEIAVKPLSADAMPKTNEGLLSLEVDFVGVPQQLNRLESALATTELAIRVNKLGIVAENNLEAGSGNLKINAQFLAFHLQPVTSPPVVSKGVPR